MRWSHPALRNICGLLILAIAPAACSDDDADGPSPGVATIGFAPKPLVSSHITLARAKVLVDRLQLIGNVPPPPPPGSVPPPGSHPPPVPPPLVTVDFDALATAPTSTSIADLPQGLYSRVRFLIGRISLEGTSRGTVFHVSLAPFGVVVDVRASAPQELGLDKDLSFQITADPNLWFPPYVFEDATLDSRGEIVCDEVSNLSIGAALIGGIASSFSLP